MQKTTKRALSLVLAVLMALSILPFSAFAKEVPSAAEIEYPAPQTQDMEGTAYIRIPLRRAESGKEYVLVSRNNYYERLEAEGVTTSEYGALSAGGEVNFGIEMSKYLGGLGTMPTILNAEVALGELTRDGDFFEPLKGYEPTRWTYNDMSSPLYKTYSAVGKVGDVESVGASIGGKTATFSITQNNARYYLFNMGYYGEFLTSPIFLMPEDLIIERMESLIMSSMNGPFWNISSGFDNYAMMIWGWYSPEKDSTIGFPLYLMYNEVCGGSREVNKIPIDIIKEVQKVEEVPIDNKELGYVVGIPSEPDFNFYLFDPIDYDLTVKDVTVAYDGEGHLPIVTGLKSLPRHSDLTIRYRLSGHGPGSWHNLDELTPDLPTEIGTYEVEIGLFYNVSKTPNDPLIDSVTATVNITDNYKTVTYDTNGGFGGPVSENVLYGEEAKKYAIIPTRQNYTFKGWDLDPSTNDPTYKYDETAEAGNEWSADAPFIVTDNVTVYAIWEEDEKVTVTYDANAGTAMITVPDAVTIYADTPYTVSSYVPQRDNYIFTGWKNGIANVAPGAVITPDKDVVLKAQWAENFTYVVTITSGTGCTACLTSPANGIVNKGGSYAFTVVVDPDYSKAKPVIEINGVKQDFTVTGITLADGSVEYKYTVTGVAENQSVFARVTVNPTVTVKYMVDGKLYTTQTIEKDDVAIEPVSPIVAGKLFKGWLKNGEVYDFDDKVSADIVLTAALADIIPGYGDDKIFIACNKNASCPIWKFDDAFPTAWYHDGVHYCLDKKLMIGVGNNKFAPNATLTRGMVVTMLWRLEGTPTVNYAMTFKDVEADQWYTEAIRWAQATGVVDGYNANAFGPKDEVTREQLMKILYNYATYKNYYDGSKFLYTMNYADVMGISPWAYDAMQWGSMAQIINGNTLNMIDAGAYATRAEAATMFFRFCRAIGK